MSNLHIAYDDVTLPLIPRDAPYVAAYVDGFFTNYNPAVAEFGAERVKGITVHGAHGDHIYFCDCETGDLTIAQAIEWVKAEVQAGHTARGPYCQVSNMQQVIDGLTREGISRDKYPIWTAHYGIGEHLCSSSCGFGFHDHADGTQFTDRADNRSLDESVVTDRWLGSRPNPNAYPGYLIKYGDRGPVVTHIQQQLVHVHHWELAIDGDFGGHTLGAVQVFQRNHGLKVDGIVGPATWGKLF